MTLEQLHGYLDTLDWCGQRLQSQEEITSTEHSRRVEELKWILARMYKQRVEDHD
jgi:hypothetical protein